MMMILLKILILAVVAVVTLVLLVVGFSLTLLFYSLWKLNPVVEELQEYQIKEKN